MITFNKNDNTVIGDATEIAEFMVQYESKLEQAKQTTDVVEEKTSTVAEESGNVTGV